MKRLVPFLFIMAGVLASGLVWQGRVVATPTRSSSVKDVAGLLQALRAQVPDPADQAAIDQLGAALRTPGMVTRSSAESPESWIVLTFDRDGALRAVALDPDRLLQAPALIQEAILLHELEHVKHAPATRRAVNGLLAQQAAYGPRVSRQTIAVLHALIRELVEEETRAYARQLRHLRDRIASAGGLEAYVARRPQAEREPLTSFYRSQVEPFVLAAGALDDRRLRAMVDSDIFPRHYPHYAAARWWDAWQQRRTIASLP